MTVESGRDALAGSDGEVALDTLTSVNAWFAGFFAFAAIHYGAKWWFSRDERILLVFSVQCALYTAFCLENVAYFRARTIPDCQAALDRFVTIGVLTHAVVVQFYAHLGNRRDRTFRAVVTGVLVFLAVLNLWAPLRGAVIELQRIELPGGVTSVLPIRTPPGASLVVLYLTVFALNGYGFFVASTIWKRDRLGAVLVFVASAVIMLGAVVGLLVDFANLRAPYAGASPHAIFVLCMAVFLAREYAARGVRVAASERQFETAFEHAPIGMALLTPEEHLFKVNRALCRMLGWSTEELCARRLHEIMHPDDASEDALYPVERRLLRRDGEAIWAQLAVAVVPDDRGRPLRLIAHMQDVTELRAHRGRLEELVETRTRELIKAKNEAEQASQAKGQFLAHMSHEFRSPLHVILGYAELLESDRTLRDTQRTRLATVRTSAQHLLRLINGVLEMSKIEAGRHELIEDPFDPWQTLDEVEGMFAGQAASKALELRSERAPELPRSLLGDGAKVKQVLINLASNALKFTKRGSIRITASSSALENETILAKIVVADTGVGIAARDAARMFQPFEQLDAGKRAGGTGLGLAISLAHARLMGGDLTVESVQDVGSTFTFTFVARCAGPQAPLGSRPSRRGGISSPTN